MAGRPLAKGTKRRATVLMIAGATSGAIARELGVHRETIRRWRLEPKIAKVVEEEGMAATEAAVALVRDVTVEAVQVALTIMRNEKAPIYARLTAVETILRRSAIDMLVAQKIETMKRQVTPDAGEQSAFNRTVDEEVDRRFRERDLKPENVFAAPAGDAAAPTATSDAPSPSVTP